MEILVYHTKDRNVKIWSQTDDTCIVQEFKDGEKSRKSTAKIKFYNGKPYVMCKGHRYYIDKFTKITI